VPPEPVPPAEPRQRWRLTFGRDLPPADEVPTGREYVGRWEEALLISGLPVAVLASGRPRIALGAPLPNGCSAEGELLEFWLTAIRPAWFVREGVTAALPAGHRAVGLQNVWLGAAALSGQIAAADYEVDVVVDGLGRADVAGAILRLFAHERLPRERQKGGTVRTYDLRPLIAALDVGGEPPAIELRMRTRIHPELGTGRPDEVVAALAGDLGVPIVIRAVSRRRLLLAEDLVA
jgi:hypothetical protein